MARRDSRDPKYRPTIRSNAWASATEARCSWCKRKRGNKRRQRAVHNHKNPPATPENASESARLSTAFHATGPNQQMDSRCDYAAIPNRQIGQFWVRVCNTTKLRHSISYVPGGTLRDASPRTGPKFGAVHIPLKISVCRKGRGYISWGKQEARNESFNPGVQHMSPAQEPARDPVSAECGFR